MTQKPSIVPINKLTELHQSIASRSTDREMAIKFSHNVLHVNRGNIGKLLGGIVDDMSIAATKHYILIVSTDFGEHIIVSPKIHWCIICTVGCYLYPSRSARFTPKQI